MSIADNHQLRTFVRVHTNTFTRPETPHNAEAEHHFWNCKVTPRYAPYFSEEEQQWCLCCCEECDACIHYDYITFIEAWPEYLQLVEEVQSQQLRLW